jgi:hypothetical protein
MEGSLPSLCSFSQIFNYTLIAFNDFRNTIGSGDILLFVHTVEKIIITVFISTVCDNLEITFIP